MNNILYASIITIGDELLIGQVIDTNSAWMAQQLNKAGVKVKRRVAVGDIWNDIWQALDEESIQSDIVLITGGLGPTSDDITKPLLCKYFGGKMIVDEAALANVNYLFEKVFKRPITERNLAQAEVPDNCKVILNRRGSAPGMWFEKQTKIFISMPGVPHEMKGIMEEIIPLLSSRFTMPYITHRTLVTFGIGESAIADMIAGFENSLPIHIKLAYLPNYGMVRLRLTAMGENQIVTDKEIDACFFQLQHLVKEFMITNKDEPMEMILGNLLSEKNKTMCTAESCTGGYIAHLITSVPGSSAYYDGSVVSYSYKAKEDLLNVDEKMLTQRGAVSEEVVLEMAKGALKNIGSDYAIAVSGIMGPGGGTTDKPAGTVWIAVGDNKKIIARKFYFRFDRQRNVQLTATNAMNLLRMFILGQL